MQVNARSQAGIIHPETGNFLELDVYLPGLKLAFEYQVSWKDPLDHPPKKNNDLKQERHHYLKDASYTNVTLDFIQNRDRLKRELAPKTGITLVIVPCWWDNRSES